CEGYAAWWAGAFQDRVLTTRGEGKLARAVRFDSDGCLGRLGRSSLLGLASVELNPCQHHVACLAGNNPADGAAYRKLLGVKIYRLSNGDEPVGQQETNASRADVYGVGWRFEGVAQQVGSAHYGWNQIHAALVLPKQLVTV